MFRFYLFLNWNRPGSFQAVGSILIYLFYFMLFYFDIFQIFICVFLFWYIWFKLKPTGGFISSCWLGQPSRDLDQSANSGFRAVRLLFIQLNNLSSVKSIYYLLLSLHNLSSVIFSVYPLFIIIFNSLPVSLLSVFYLYNYTIYHPLFT